MSETRWRPSASLATLRQRAAMLARARDFFARREVLEVETSALIAHPVSEPHLASVACEMALYPGRRLFLHTSPEYQMKRLLAAGAPDIFQICKVFRDREQGPRHLPEFTMIEWYRHGLQLDEMIAETCELTTELARAAGRSLAPPRRYAYRDLCIEHLNLNPLDAEPSALAACAARLLGEETVSAVAGAPAQDRTLWLDLLVTHAIEPALRPQGLVVITGYPAEQAALARLDPQDARCAERFELLLDGVELANGYRELTDAAEQRLRFAADRERRRRLGLPDVAPDPALLAALEAGLPDCCGVALGLDRLMMTALGLPGLEAAVGFGVTAPA